MTKTAPYPADTRAKGWRFELDHERIRQSDTWALAPADLRPWLLMLWMVAWEQTPCASLPADDVLIAARLGMPAKMFAKNRDLLMRGWWAADDGRIYHDVMNERVLEMLEYRRKNAKRVADFKAAKRELQGGNALPTREHQVSNDTGTGTTLQDKPVEKPARKRASAPECPDGVDPQVWSDWLALRKAKKAPVTETVIASSTAEAAKAGLSLESFLRVWCARGSQGLQAEWLKPNERQQSTGETAWQRSQRERVAEMTGGLVSAKPPGYTGQVVEMPNAALKLG